MKRGKRKREAQDGLPLVEIDFDPAHELARILGGAVVAGLDEAGRGPLAGPVVAACVVLPDELPEVLHGLNDSKQLTEEQREALYPHIVQHARAFGVRAIEADRIDEVNILRASLQAMAESFLECQTRIGHSIPGAIIDGDKKAPLPMTVVQRTVIGGDAKCRAVMAASILAKVTRDRRMVEEHGRYPVYGFDAHQGYGTPQHLAALREHGPCVLHRRSFAPVRVAYGETVDAVAVAEAAVADDALPFGDA
jgi:ribonuclease HII